MSGRRPRGQAGQGLVEYALILIMVSVVVVVILITLGVQVYNMLSNVSTALGA
jgi:pilus assembly protein Flp/PilA